MRRSLLATAALAAAIPLAAQTNYTAPSGFLTKPGGFVCSGWGVYHEGRTQYIYSGVSIAKAAYKQVSLRTQNTKTYTTENGAARSWRRMRLSLGQSNPKNRIISKTFSSNYNLGKPTKVFDGTFSLRQLSGKPRQAWGSVTVIGFATNYAYGGGGMDLVHDWQWDGGKLANGGKWQFHKNYLTDGASGANTHQIIATPTSSQSPGSKWLPKSPFGSPSCNDSAIRATNRSAYAEMRVRIFSDGHPLTSQRGRADISGAYSSYTAPGAPVLGVVSYLGFDPGISVSLRCNKLHVVPNAALATGTGTAANNQSAIASFFTRQLRDYKSWYPGRSLYFQAAWADSRTGQASLTIASKLVLPKKPQSYLLHLVYEAWSVDGNKRQKFGPITTAAGGAMPILNFAK